MDRKSACHWLIILLFVNTLFAAGIKTDSVSCRTIAVSKGGPKVLIDTLRGITLLSVNQFDDMDVIHLAQARSVGATGAPALAQTGEGYSLTQWNVNDSLEGDVELTHRFMINDTAYFHIHYLTGVQDGTTRFIKWQFHYIIKNDNDSTVYDSTISAEDTIQTTVKKLSLRRLDISSIQTPNIGLGSYIFIVVKRITASNTAPSVNPFGITAGIHRRVNNFGSLTRGAK